MTITNYSNVIDTRIILLAHAALSSNFTAAEAFFLNHRASSFCVWDLQTGARVSTTIVLLKVQVASSFFFVG